MELQVVSATAGGHVPFATAPQAPGHHLQHHLRGEEGGEGHISKVQQGPRAGPGLDPVVVHRKQGAVDLQHHGTAWRQHKPESI